MQAAKESLLLGFFLFELEYIYAVARIRALESSLLTQSVIEQLMACQNETQCLQLLSEKGWGDPADAHDPVKMLQREEEKKQEQDPKAQPQEEAQPQVSYREERQGVEQVWEQPGLQEISDELERLSGRYQTRMEEWLEDQTAI